VKQIASTIRGSACSRAKNSSRVGPDASRSMTRWTLSVWSISTAKPMSP
jgi:hypothetical protein